MKTIFYKLIKNKDDANYWFDDIPAKEWFTLENFLYEPNGNIKKNIIIPKDGKNFIYSISVNKIEDTFTDKGLIRRIGLWCYEF